MHERKKEKRALWEQRWERSRQSGKKYRPWRRESSKKCRKEKRTSGEQTEGRHRSTARERCQRGVERQTAQTATSHQGRRGTRRDAVTPRSAGQTGRGARVLCSTSQISAQRFLDFNFFGTGLDELAIAETFRATSPQLYRQIQKNVQHPSSCDTCEMKCQTLCCNSDGQMLCKELIKIVQAVQRQIINCIITALADDLHNLIRLAKEQTNS